MIQQPINFNKSEVSYFQSFMIVDAIIIFGLLLQFFSGSINISFLQFPANLFILVVLVVSIVIGHLKFKQSKIVQWLSSSKAAIVSIIGFSFVTLLMGFITQGETSNVLIQKLGLNNIAFSWIYFFVLLLLIYSLGFATIKRIYPFRKQNFWYILNHLGLWITLVAANFGYADQTHLRMKISTAGFSSYAFSEAGGIQELPFEIKQKSFKLENYSPKLTIMDIKTSMLSMKSGKNTIEAKQNASLIIENWSITIVKSYNYARSIKDTIVEFEAIGSAPAVLVRVENLATKEIKQAWVSCGNSLIDQMSLPLDSSHTLVMLLPTSKEFVLGAEIKKKNKVSNCSIAVNSPQEIDGWKMYIVSYNEQMGKWSDSTVIELIKDSWQPLVYVGLSMMILGSFFVFWRGKK